MNAPKEEMEVAEFSNAVKHRSDRLMNYFLGTYFAVGLVLAWFYDTWLVAIGVGGLSILAYYSAKLVLPKSNLYQYVLSIVMGVFMAQFIYQMHGLFEMHFFAFIGAAILITYQNWKLQIPLAVFVVAHHAAFGLLQYSGLEGIYFTQLDFMSLQTFVIHGILATTVFALCGLWAYNFEVSSWSQIQKSYEIGKLREAESQNEALRKANTELDRFVYSASHEMRAPLTSVMGLLSLARMEESDGGKLKVLDMMQLSIDRLDRFVKDIAMHSSNSRTDLVVTEIDFRELIAESLEQLSYFPELKRIAIDISVEGEVKFGSDHRRIVVVLANLLSNAIKYQRMEVGTPRIDIQVVVDAKEAKIAIKDNGIGIEPEYQDKIFNMFYRATVKRPGAGLGLYIAKEIVDRMSGTITVESTPNVGTTFYVTIPNSEPVHDQTPVEAVAIQ